MDRKVSEIANILSTIKRDYFPLMPEKEYTFFESDFKDIDIMVNTNFDTFPERDDEIDSILGYMRDILKRCQNDFGK